jgi:hypothetical protein
MGASSQWLSALDRAQNGVKWGCGNGRYLTDLRRFAAWPAKVLLGEPSVPAAANVRGGVTPNH